MDVWTSVLEGISRWCGYTVGVQKYRTPYDPQFCQFNRWDSFQHAFLHEFIMLSNMPSSRSLLVAINAVFPDMVALKSPLHLKKTSF